MVAVWAASHCTAVSAEQPDHAGASRDWPMFRGNAMLTGVCDSALPDKPAPRWTLEREEGFPSSAAIVGDRVFVGCEDGTLYALNLSTGELRWQYDAGAPIQSSPLVAGSVVFFGDDDGFFHAVDADAGSSRWTFRTDGQIISSANHADGRVVFGSYDGSLYCLQAATGALLWKHPTEGQIHGTPAIVGDRAIVAGCDQGLHVVSLKDGAGGPVGAMGSQSGASAAIDGARIFLGTYGNQVIAMDWKNGGVPWRFEDPDRQFPFMSSAAVANGVVVIGGRDKRVRAFGADDGSVRWTFLTKGRVDSSPVIVGDRVFVGSSDGNVYEIALSDGAERWRFETGSPITASPAIAHGRLVVGTMDGVLYCFGPPD